jgi:hypothetical protein
LSSYWSFSFWLSHQYPICIPFHPHSFLTPCPSRPPWLHTNYTCKDYKLISLLCSFLQIPVTSSILSPNNFLNTLLLNTLSLCSSLNARHQVSHPYRTTGKIIIICIVHAFSYPKGSARNGVLMIQYSKFPFPLFCYNYITERFISRPCQ